MLLVLLQHSYGRSNRVNHLGGAVYWRYVESLFYNYVQREVQSSLKFRYYTTYYIRREILLGHGCYLQILSENGLVEPKTPLST